LPRYYDRDRRWFLIQRHFYNYTYDFVNKTEEGKAIPNERGEYEMYDTGRPVFNGVINLKGRRRGDTYKSGCMGLEIITRAEHDEQTFSS